MGGYLKGIYMKASEINLDETYSGSQNSKHRRPREAGSADRYYDRGYNPNFAYNGYTYHEGEMTREQIQEYSNAYWGETDRKPAGISPFPVEA